MGVDPYSGAVLAAIALYSAYSTKTASRQSARKDDSLEKDKKKQLATVDEQQRRAELADRVRRGKLSSRQGFGSTIKTGSSLGGGAGQGKSLLGG